MNLPYIWDWGVRVGQLKKTAYWLIMCFVLKVTYVKACCRLPADL